MEIPLGTLLSLSEADQFCLRKANLQTVTDVLIPSLDTLAKKTQTSVSDAERIVQLISREILDPPLIVDSARALGSEACTTGDGALDQLIGGGFRTGVIWEVTGEGASGKTQLALQLSLMVQLPVEAGGLNGSACYITAGSTLATNRLDELIDHHPLLSEIHCDLADIHTCNVSIDTPKALTYYLREALPSLIESKLSTNKPVKLIVIDSIAAVFRGMGKSTTQNLFDRSKYLGEVSALMHAMIVKYRMAAVVLNEVTAVFGAEAGSSEAPMLEKNELLYKVQSRWFNRPDDTFWDDKQDAFLGLVWANQVNVRLFLSRTQRNTDVEVHSLSYEDGDEGEERGAKRRRIDAPNLLDAPIPTTTTARITLRRLDVIFSCFSPPRSIDFILTPAGLKALPPTTATTKSGYFGGVVDVSGAGGESTVPVQATQPSVADDDDMFDAVHALDAEVLEEEKAAGEVLDPD